MNRLFEIHDLQPHVDLADLLELLSIALTNPTPELSAALTDGRYCADLTSCLKGVGILFDSERTDLLLKEIAACAQSFAAQETDTLHRAVNREFTRLFVSPRNEKLPLYESLFVHRGEKKASMFINPTCMHCEQEYRKHGFSFPEKGKIPGDHAAIELKYVAFLLAKRILALSSNDANALENVDSLLMDFSAAHLSRWLLPFSNELRATSTHPFYQLIASICLHISSCLVSKAA